MKRCVQEEGRGRRRLEDHFGLEQAAIPPSSPEWGRPGRRRRRWNPSGVVLHPALLQAVSEDRPGLDGSVRITIAQGPVAQPRVGVRRSVGATIAACREDAETRYVGHEGAVQCRGRARAYPAVKPRSPASSRWQEAMVAWASDFPWRALPADTFLSNDHGRAGEM